MQHPLITGSRGLVALMLIIAIATVAIAEPPPPETGRSPLAPPPMGAMTWLPAPPVEAQSQIPNLLVNGNFDELSFYWRYPNHFVAGGWIRWWIGTALPEYDDACPAAVLRWRPCPGLLQMGHTYEAGIYQVVSGLTPCTPYRFTIGPATIRWKAFCPIRALAWTLRVHNSLPDRMRAAVPRPAWTPLQNRLVPEQTALFTWEELSVEAEPLWTRLTAISLCPS